ncbi:hypothetical protein DFJ73DRAFT_864453 [Zopfochytrium polystomum]|nr:hypothetical protein DFJ73DRAFT_864453 [Zopfochytrium polystomum]
MITALSIILSLISASTVHALTAVNYYSTAGCATALGLTSTTSLSSSCTPASCSANPLNPNSFQTTTCPSSSSIDYAATLLGKRTYVGVIYYADLACTTELTSYFFLADGVTCVWANAAGYKASIMNGRGTLASYTTKDCSGVAASSDADFASTKCGSGLTAMRGYVVVSAGSVIGKAQVIRSGITAPVAAVAAAALVVAAMA